jgi:hypothetical protein
LGIITTRSAPPPRLRKTPGPPSPICCTKPATSAIWARTVYIISPGAGTTKSSTWATASN